VKIFPKSFMPKKTFRKIEPLTSQMRVVLKDPLGSGIVGIVVQGEAEALAAAVRSCADGRQVVGLAPPGGRFDFMNRGWP
jgi:hypothetical protein